MVIVVDALEDDHFVARDVAVMVAGLVDAMPRIDGGLVVVGS